MRFTTADAPWTVAHDFTVLLCVGMYDLAVTLPARVFDTVDRVQLSAQVPSLHRFGGAPVFTLFWNRLAIIMYWTLGFLTGQSIDGAPLQCLLVNLPRKTALSLNQGGGAKDVMGKVSAPPMSRSNHELRLRRMQRSGWTLKCGGSQLAGGLESSGCDTISMARLHQSATQPEFGRCRNPAAAKFARKRA